MAGQLEEPAIGGNQEEAKARDDPNKTGVQGAWLAVVCLAVYEEKDPHKRPYIQESSSTPEAWESSKTVSYYSLHVLSGHRSLFVSILSYHTLYASIPSTSSCHLEPHPASISTLSPRTSLFPSSSAAEHASLSLEGP